MKIEQSQRSPINVISDTMPVSKSLAPCQDLHASLSINNNNNNNNNTKRQEERRKNK